MIRRPRMLVKRTLHCTSDVQAKAGVPRVVR